VEDGAPISFQVRASFKGPTLKVLEPVVDYGLVKINTSSKYRISVENTSPISCEILVRPFRFGNINFDNFEKNLEKIRSVFTTDGNIIRIDKPVLNLGPNARGDFLMTLDAVK
jgi:hypothetical protein